VYEIPVPWIVGKSPLREKKGRVEDTLYMSSSRPGEKEKKRKGGPEPSARAFLKS